MPRRKIPLLLLPVSRLSFISSVYDKTEIRCISLENTVPFRITLRLIPNGEHLIFELVNALIYYLCYFLPLVFLPSDQDLFFPSSEALTFFPQFT